MGNAYFVIQIKPNTCWVAVLHIDEYRVNKDLYFHSPISPLPSFAKLTNCSRKEKKNT